jgi:hypothetical protein
MFTDVAELLIASTVQALMMEAVRMSERMVKLYQNSQRNMPEESSAHT